MNICSYSSCSIRNNLEPVVEDGGLRGFSQLLSGTYNGEARFVKEGGRWSHPGGNAAIEGNNRKNERQENGLWKLLLT